MVYIPYLLRSKLIQIDPMLDTDWQSQLELVFEGLDQDMRIEIDKQILQPKQIIWHRISNTFETKAETSLQVLKFKLEDNRMRAIVSNILDSVQVIQNNNNILFFADYIENILNQIDQIEIGDDLTLLEDRTKIRKTFLYHIAKVIQKKSFIIPANIRALSEDQIKNFIIEVYIKNEILGPWFRPLTSFEVKQEPNFFFKYYISKQQKIRNFSVVKTSQYYFIIAPGKEAEDNIFSIRRFLTEQIIEYNDATYIFGLVLPLDPSADPHYINTFKNLMEKMVTIEYRISQTIVDTVAKIEDDFQKQLVPLFIEPVMVTEKNLDLVVQQHLKKIEDIIVEKILTPLKYTLDHHLSLQDEYDYMFYSIQSIFKEMVSFFEVFKQQPLFIFNQKIQEFGYRLLSYLMLLERRRDEVFSAFSRQDREFLNQRAQQPLEELYQLINHRLAEYLTLQKEIKAIERERLNKPKVSLFSHFKAKKNDKKDYNELYHEAMELKKKAYFDLLYLPKQYKKYCVMIQDTNLMSIQGRETYYAFNNGENGVGLLPVLFHMKNDLTDFSIENIYTTLCTNMTKYSPFIKKEHDGHIINT